MKTQKCRSLFFKIGLLSLVIFSTFAVQAQDSDKKEAKKKGATVKGRVVYDDTNRPVRYVTVGLVKADKNSSYHTKINGETDGNGEFVIENVKTGTYQLFVKNAGILNPDVYKRTPQIKNDEAIAETLFQKVSVNGFGEFNFNFSVRRGGAISGVVRYADGEVAAGVTIEVLRKVGEKFWAYPVRGLSISDKSITDDRGFYRIAGLPEGKYTVRVIEPISHKHKQESKSISFGYSSSSSKDYLMTYYPSSKTAADANELDVFFGQEQTAIDISIPKRELFDVSGKVVLKSTGEELKNYDVKFYKVNKTDDGLKYGDGNKLMTLGGSFYDDEKPSRWTLKSLPKGKYVLTASQLNVRSRDGKKQVKRPDVIKEIEIIDSDLQDVVFEVPDSGTAKGVIYDRDGRNLKRYMSIYAYDLSAKKSGDVDIDYSKYDEENSATQKQLTFEISKVTTGEISLSSFGESYYIDHIIVNGRKLNSNSFELPTNQFLEGIQIVVASDKGTLKGRISGIPQSGSAGIFLINKASVISGNPKTSQIYVVRKNDKYEMKVPPGDYYVAFEPHKFDDEVDVRSFIGNAKSITIRPFGTVNLNLSYPQD